PRPTAGPAEPAARSDDSMRRFLQPVFAGADEASPLLGRLAMGIRADRATRQAWLFSLPVLVSAAALVLTFLGFFFVLQRRVRRMVAFAEQLAQGNLAARLDDRARDELGRLSSALRKLRDS